MRKKSKTKVMPKKDFSNRTVAVMLAIVIVVTLIGIILNLGALGESNESGSASSDSNVIDSASPTGKVSLQIIPSPPENRGVSEE